MRAMLLLAQTAKRTAIATILLGIGACATTSAGKTTARVVLVCSGAEAYAADWSPGRMAELAIPEGCEAATLRFE